MEYQYIEKGNRRLYSIYHEPEHPGREDTGIVLCYPLGHEYIRCHRLNVNLAHKLAREGFHVLRFDYSGTGDSAGDFTSLTVEGCLEDIGMAVSELKDACGITRVGLAGVRFGATLSLLYMQQQPVDMAVVWNPVYDGTRYLRDIQQEYHAWKKGMLVKEKAMPGNSISCFGFHYDAAFLQQVAAIRPETVRFPTDSTLLLIDEKAPANVPPQLTYLPSHNKEFWLKRDHEKEKSMVPVAEINAILQWINEKTEE
ncbi:serine aminopeptidase domain-containing protein [Chitinophaga nivalis]|uniref:Alpha/beta hydrolase n=1 Tax=Chitinophaga nivalis TaxID=2991709 RepID=A0ABT3IJU1_9BACT|nr:alpha/beta hydrolase [Chitinophaga nivalis]MCW3466082.1 alpha/beta hydrolase [Chitinophaga nivalis]MCW3484227.1 alpha/beta hydrolase [Chitinophaga nivalis]